jgi:hypothetical protein
VIGVLLRLLRLDKEQWDLRGGTAVLNRIGKNSGSSGRSWRMGEGQWRWYRDGLKAPLLLVKNPLLSVSWSETLYSSHSDIIGAGRTTALAPLCLPVSLITSISNRFLPIYRRRPVAGADISISETVRPYRGGRPEDAFGFLCSA